MMIFPAAAATLPATGAATVGLPALTPRQQGDIPLRAGQVPATGAVHSRLKKSPLPATGMEIAQCVTPSKAASVWESCMGSPSRETPGLLISPVSGKTRGAIRRRT